jgi:hypothetical protein
VILLLVNSISFENLSETDHMEAWGHEGARILKKSSREHLRLLVYIELNSETSKERTQDLVPDITLQNFAPGANRDSNGALCSLNGRETSSNKKKRDGRGKENRTAITRMSMRPLGSIPSTESFGVTPAAPDQAVGHTDQTESDQMWQPQQRKKPQSAAERTTASAA